MQADLTALLAEAERHPFRMARGHIRRGPLVAYLRIGPRYVHGVKLDCIQIANVDVDEDHQHKGHFTALLAELLALGKPIFAEQVLNHRLGDALIRRGFAVIRTDDLGTRDLLLRNEKVG